MKQINFTEINSRKYTNKTVKNDHPTKSKTAQQNNYPKKAAIHSNNKPRKKRHQTYNEAYQELNEYIFKIRYFTLEYIKLKKKDKGFFGRILSKLLRIEEKERQSWIEEVAESNQIQHWMDKINKLVDFIYLFYGKDLTNHVEKQLGNLFPDYY